MANAVVKVAILASGEGTNAERLMRAAAEAADVDIVWVGSNRASAGVMGRAERLGVPCGTFNRSALQDGSVLRDLKMRGVDFVALAGFLMKVPDDLVSSFSGRMLNLHPSLLPAFGGHGMYGHHVHAAVAAALAEGRVKETGITLHWVDAEYDTGPVFFQAAVALSPGEGADTIARKIQQLEGEHYATQVLRAVRESCSLPLSASD